MMPDTNEQVTISSCTNDCGGKCVLKVHHRDGKITRITTDDGDDLQLRACVRGRAFRYRTYAEDRLKYPMKRVGERGEGKFERISWDEAFDQVASEIGRIRDSHGAEAILDARYAGSALGILHNTHSGPSTRFFNLLGGRTAYGSWISLEGAFFSSMYTYGNLVDANEPDDLPNARLIVLWGVNPAETVQGTNTSWFLVQAREKGTKIIVVDPCYTDTAKAFAHQWIPIRPGTDAAMFAAMAFVMIREDIYDKAFIERYTVGFEKYRDYILGRDDGISKTPAWASPITGVIERDIVQLARDYATRKPGALIQGFAPGRTAYGEQFHRSASTIQAMTGNIGIHGGSASCTHYSFGLGGWKISGIPLCEDLPLGGFQHYGEIKREYQKSSRKKGPKVNYIKAGEWSEAVLKGKKGGYASDVKMIYVVGHNLINQNMNTNKGVLALKSVESVIVHELFMTPTAKFADILLPVNTVFERSDIVVPWLKGYYSIYCNKIIPSLHECKSDLAIFTELAKRLGIKEYNPKDNDEEWLRGFVEDSDIPDFDRFKKEGVHRFRLKEPFVAFKDQIENPVENPFPTPSGKIEIFSERLDKLDFSKTYYGRYIPPIPKYEDDWEGPHTKLAKKYPLQLITCHTKYRIHSQFDNIPEMKELFSQEVWINARDAEERGIKDGDSVQIFNDRGTICVPAKVTERIMPGVVKIYEGGWFSPDEEGVDRGGCGNVLVADAPSPAGAQNYNTALVEVKLERKPVS
jgi:anaerobic dimethyl sulfoxide reductase subunit A